jgi:hypothetical protein
MCETMFFFQCPGMSQPLDSATPGRPPNVHFLGWERYVFMFLCEKKCACGHGLRMVTSGDKLGRRLHILLKSHSSLCRLLSNLNFELLKSVKYGRGGRAHKENTESKCFKIYLSNFSC